MWFLPDEDIIHQYPDLFDKSMVEKPKGVQVSMG